MIFLKKCAGGGVGSERGGGGVVNNYGTHQFFASNFQPLV